MAHTIDIDRTGLSCCVTEAHYCTGASGFLTLVRSRFKVCLLSCPTLSANRVTKQRSVVSS